MKNKVSNIEFHIVREEADDCILRAAKLIKEGYTLASINLDTPTFSYRTVIKEPYIHIVFQKVE